MKKLDTAPTALLEAAFFENINVIGRLRDCVAHTFYSLNADEGFVFEHDGWYAPYGCTEAVLSAHLKGFDFGETPDFCGLPYETAQTVLKTLDYYALKWEEPCYLMVLPKDADTPAAADTDSLTEADVAYVDRYYTYKEPGSDVYLRRCIAENPSSVIRDESGMPISWALIREDGSMGVMYTLKGHRGKGLALKVSTALISKARAAGFVPYVHIATDNTASVALAKSLGMVLWGEVLWFGLCKK